MNLTAGKDLIGKKQGGRKIVDIAQAKQSVSRIFHGGESGTQTPVYWWDSKKQTVYFDNPGFFDNRGEEVEIINAFYVRSVLKKS